MADFRHFPSWSGLTRPSHGNWALSEKPCLSMVRKIAGDGRVTPDHDERGRQRSYAIALGGLPGGSHMAGFRHFPSWSGLTRPSHANGAPSEKPCLFNGA